MKKVGIFAGTFDPVHDGHIAFAEAATKYLDKVFLLVEPRPRRKQGVKSLEHRFEMARLATKNNPNLGVIKLDQARFTPRDTMPKLSAMFKGAEISLLFGDDVVSRMVDNIAEWPYVEELLGNSKLLIATRRHDNKELTERLKNLKQYDLRVNYSYINVGKVQVSSSVERQKLKKKEQMLCLNKDVAAYIQRHQLYSSIS